MGKIIHNDLKNVFKIGIAVIGIDYQLDILFKMPSYTLNK